jgi:hypothetical protein
MFRESLAVLTTDRLNEELQPNDVIDAAVYAPKVRQSLVAKLAVDPELLGGHVIPPDHFLMRSIMQAVRCLGWKQRKRKVRARILRATELFASTLRFTGAPLSRVQRPHAAMHKLRIVTLQVGISGGRSLTRLFSDALRFPPTRV